MSPHAPAAGSIIVLNGTSSSGKTSIVRALQDVFQSPWLDAGIDKFLWMLPSRYLDPPLWQLVYTYQFDESDPPRIIAINPAALGNQIVFGMHTAIASLAVAGCNVIADHVLAHDLWLADCASHFANLPAWFVGVQCPLEVAEARERSRGNRTLGWARAHHASVHSHGVYDIEVNTAEHSPEVCAAKIAAYVAQGGAPRAFAEIRRRYQG